MKKVLVMDDDKYLTDDLKEFFEFEQIPIEVVNTADEMLEKLESVDSYQAVVLDIMMRKGSHLAGNEGDETGELIYRKLREKAPDLEVVILSAKEKSDVHVNFDHPNTDYVSKPVGTNIEQLISYVSG